MCRKRGVSLVSHLYVIGRSWQWTSDISLLEKEKNREVTLLVSDYEREVNHGISNLVGD